MTTRFPYRFADRLAEAFSDPDALERADTDDLRDRFRAPGGGRVTRETMWLASLRTQGSTAEQPHLLNAKPGRVRDAPSQVFQTIGVAIITSNFQRGNDFPAPNRPKARLLSLKAVRKNTLRGFASGSCAGNITSPAHRDKEDAPSTAITVAGGTARPTATGRNPSERHQGVLIYFESENCPLEESGRLHARRLAAQGHADR
jgi:hypothetical protein